MQLTTYNPVLDESIWRTNGHGGFGPVRNPIFGTAAVAPLRPGADGVVCVVCAKLAPFFLCFPLVLVPDDERSQLDRADLSTKKRHEEAPEWRKMRWR